MHGCCGKRRLCSLHADVKLRTARVKISQALLRKDLTVTPHINPQRLPAGLIATAIHKRLDRAYDTP